MPRRQSPEQDEYCSAPTGTWLVLSYKKPVSVLGGGGHTKEMLHLSHLLGPEYEYHYLLVREVPLSPDAIDRAEDRERFDDLLEPLGLKRPPGAVARSPEEGEAVALSPAADGDMEAQAVRLDEVVPDLSRRRKRALPSP